MNLPRPRILLPGLALLLACGGPLEPMAAYRQALDAEGAPRSVPLAEPRFHHADVLLPLGQVLISGGQGPNGVSLGTSELYDPATFAWSATYPMTTPRSRHTATVLKSGQVLVAGGGAGPVHGASAELYEPSTQAWSPTGSMLEDRSQHTAVLLASGLVLVAGGSRESDSLRTAELYDPASGTWSPTGNMLHARRGHSATVLPSGKVLVAGGEQASAELYDPETHSWSETGSMASSRIFHRATLLPSGQVLVTGGLGDGTSPEEAELYDPATGSWRSAGVMGHRVHHSATLLPLGLVFVAGGESCRRVGDSLVCTPEPTALVYRVNEGTWSSPFRALKASRRFHSATLMSSGWVLLAGGDGDPSATTAELHTQHPPLISSLTVRTEHDTSVEVGLLATDENDDAVTYTVLTEPASGSLSGTAPALVYTPDRGFSGTDTFTYQVSDGAQSSRVATVSLIVAKAPGGGCSASAGGPRGAWGLVLGLLMCLAAGRRKARR